jgi:hypothetical protein
VHDVNFDKWRSQTSSNIRMKMSVSRLSKEGRCWAEGLKVLSTPATLSERAAIAIVLPDQLIALHLKRRSEITLLQMVYSKRFLKKT